METRRKRRGAKCAPELFTPPRVRWASIRRSFESGRLILFHPIRRWSGPRRRPLPFGVDYGIVFRLSGSRSWPTPEADYGSDRFEMSALVLCLHI